MDNYLHENQKGSHIHVYQRDDVKRVNTNFQDAHKLIKEISGRILRDKFTQNIDFGDD